MNLQYNHLNVSMTYTVASVWNLSKFNTGKFFKIIPNPVFVLHHIMGTGNWEGTYLVDIIVLSIMLSISIVMNVS